MGSYGFGAALGLHRLGPPPPQAVIPSAEWTGEPGSGFASTPIDPARVTAKPIAQMIVPPHQWFTHDLVVGVAAFASANGTLMGGIDRVRFRFEGGTTDVLFPSLRTFTREDGTTYDCLAYWITLKKPARVAGEAQLFVEVIAADATMQHRVLGPFSFFPATAPHDQTVTVGATGDYTSIGSALAALKAAGAQNPLIEVQAGSYAFTGGGTSYVGDGYLTIRPAAGASVTLMLPEGSEGEVRTKYDRLWIEGCTFDLNTIESIYNEGLGNHVFKNCRFIRSEGRSLWFKNVPGASYLVRNNAWFLENYFYGAYEAFGGASLARGNIGGNGWGDMAGNALCTLYNEIDDWIGNDAVIDPEKGFLRIQYAGSGTSITLSRTLGGSGAAENKYRRFVLKVDGVTVLTFDAWQSWTRHDLGDNRYTVQDFANAISTVAGFSATVLDNGVAARALNVDPANNNQDFTNYGLGKDHTLVANLDIHADAIANGLKNSNIIHFSNKLTNFASMQLLITGAGLKDFVLLNNILDRGSDELSASFSRIENGAVSHVLVAHNSWRGQRVFVEDDAPFDAYSLMSNNVAPEIKDTTGTVTGSGNVVAAPGAGHVAGVGLTVAGDSTSWYADAANRDFTPAGELLENLYPPVFGFDGVAARTAALAPVGAAR